MKLLAEFLRHENAVKEGRTILRQAVRAIILRPQGLLMIHSPVNGDYKFPGGGVEAGETHRAALVREVREECGARVMRVGRAFGRVIEYDIPKETDYDVFRMTSDYYLCRVEENRSSLSLDGYELDLGFHPVWIGVDDAIQANRRVLCEHPQAKPLWTERDTFVLEQVKLRWDELAGSSLCLS